MNEWEMEMDEQFLDGKIRKQIDGGPHISAID